MAIITSMRITRDTPPTATAGIITRDRGLAVVNFDSTSVVSAA